MCMELLVIEWSHRAPGHGMVGTVLRALSVLSLSPPQASLVIGTIIMAILLRFPQRYRDLHVAQRIVARTAR